MKTWLLSLFFVASIASAVGLPLAYHWVTFQNRWHLIPKDRWGWDQTSLDLDRNPQAWFVVAQSPSLRGYLLRHSKEATTEALKKHTQGWLNRLRHEGRKTLKKVEDSAKTQAKEWLRR